MNIENQSTENVAGRYKIRFEPIPARFAFNQYSKTYSFENVYGTPFFTYHLNRLQYDVLLPSKSCRIFVSSCVEGRVRLGFVTSLSFSFGFLSFFLHIIFRPEGVKFDYLETVIIIRT